MRNDLCVLHETLSSDGEHQLPETRTTIQNSPFCIHQNLANILSREIKVYGFTIMTLLPKYRDTFYAEVPALIASGEIKLREDLSKGLESAGEAILAVQRGTNAGRSVILVAEQ